MGSSCPWHNPSMRRRREPVANKLVAQRMQDFFDHLPERARSLPAETARCYADHMFDHHQRELVDQKRFSRARFHVGIGIDPAGFDRVMKRAALVADTLMLSHNGAGTRHRVSRLPPASEAVFSGIDPVMGFVDTAGWDTTKFDLYCYCPDLEYLGRWLLETEPLLRAGSAWYLPVYSLDRTESFESAFENGRFFTEDSRQVRVPGLLDFLQVGQRVVALDDVHPVTAAVVRPVVNDLELPFLDGIPLDEFSAITAGEFDAYQAFQSWLQQRLLEVDTALGSVDSERELAKIGLQIKDEVRGLEYRMRQVRQRRAVSATGAAVGTVTASLTAVLASSEVASAVAAFIGGASGGLWSTIQASFDNSPKKLRESPWYYVWTLSRADRSRG
jgi:hypothetical protein